MKVLHLHGYFLLPNDFNGSVEDAVKLYFQYRKETPVEQPEMDLVSGDYLWEEFLDGVRHSDIRWIGDIGVSGLDE